MHTSCLIKEPVPVLQGAPPSDFLSKCQVFQEAPDALLKGTCARCGQSVRSDIPRQRTMEGKYAHLLDANGVCIATCSVRVRLCCFLICVRCFLPEGLVQLAGQGNMRNLPHASHNPECPHQDSVGWICTLPRSERKMHPLESATQPGSTPYLCTVVERSRLRQGLTEWNCPRLRSRGPQPRFY
jgi:hypothetical protein